MNKFLTKIATFGLGMIMAIGVGVAAANSEFTKVSAAGETTVTCDDDSALTTSGKTIGDILIKTSSANSYTNPCRFYANTTITISCKSEDIVLVSVTYTASSTGNYVTYAQEATVDPSVAPTVSNKDVTWDLSGKDSQNFSIKPKSQTRWNSISITYKTVGSSTTAYLDSLLINNSESILLTEGATYDVPYTGLDSEGNAWNGPVSFISTDETIVSFKGSTLTALKPGETTIYAVAEEAGEGGVDIESEEIEVSVKAVSKVTYKKASKLVGNKEYYIAGLSNSNEVMFMGPQAEGKSFRTVANVGNLTEDGTVEIVESKLLDASLILAQEIGGNFAFLIDDSYLTATADGVAVSGELNNSSTWSVVFGEGSLSRVTSLNESLKNNLLQYNKSNPRITCYAATSNQFDLYFFEKLDVNKVASHLEVSGTLENTVFADGEEFDPTGLTIEVVFTDSEKYPNEDVTEFVTWSSLSEGDTSVTGTFENLDIIISGITVTAAIPTELTVKNQLTNFGEYQLFTLEPGKAELHYSDGSKTTMPLNQLTVTLDGKNIFDGYRMEAEDDGKTVTLSYLEFTVSYNVYVEEFVMPQGNEVTSWNLVEDVNNLTVGDIIIIAASGSNYALGTTQNDNNRKAEAITKSNDKKTLSSPSSSIQQITLKAGTKSNTFSFYVGTAGYLYAASSSSNYLKTKTNLDDNGSWKITISSGGVASITAQGSYTRNQLKKNSSSALFSCYGSGQNDVCIYKLTTSSTTDTKLINIINFIEECMYLDDSLNNHENTGACKEYYDNAKKYYTKTLTDDERELFCASEEHIISAARERLVAWALANNEQLNSENQLVSTLKVAILGIDSSNPESITLLIVTALIALSTVAVIYFKKREQTLDN